MLLLLLDDEGRIDGAAFLQVELHQLVEEALLLLEVKGVLELLLLLVVVVLLEQELVTVEVVLKLLLLAVEAQDGSCSCSSRRRRIRTRTHHRIVHLKKKIQNTRDNYRINRIIRIRQKQPYGRPWPADALYMYTGTVYSSHAVLAENY